MRQRVWAALTLVLALWLPACAASRPDPSWQSAEVKVLSENVLWQVTRVALEKNNFPIGAGIDPAKMSAVSGWNHSLAPFRGKGWRERCYVNWKRKGEGHWTVEVRVERDRNDDISHPLDLSYADWKPDPDNVERARRVLQHIRSMLAGS